MEFEHRVHDRVAPKELEYDEAGEECLLLRRSDAVTGRHLQQDFIGGHLLHLSQDGLEIQKDRVARVSVVGLKLLEVVRVMAPCEILSRFACDLRDGDVLVEVNLVDSGLEELP